MKKYWSLMKIYFASAMIKKADILGDIVINLIQIWAVLLIWLNMYSPNKTFAGFTLRDTIVYYITILLISYATTTDTADYISQNIKMGTLSEWLLRPRDILFTEIARSIGSQLYKLIVLVPVYLSILIILSILKVNIGLTVIGILLGCLFMVLGFLLNCIFEFMLAQFAFWMDEVWSIKHFKEVITDLLGGKRIPLNFFPVFIQSFNKYLPFQFIYFIPAEYILNKHTVNLNLAQDLTGICLWILLLFLLSVILFKQGIKKYGAFGN
jgi:ABC-2 type transport system permease protein